MTVKNGPFRVGGGGEGPAPDPPPAAPERSISGEGDPPRRGLAAPISGEGGASPFTPRYTCSKISLQSILAGRWWNLSEVPHGLLQGHAGRLWTTLLPLQALVGPREGDLTKPRSPDRISIVLFVLVVRV